MLNWAATVGAIGCLGSWTTQSQLTDGTSSRNSAETSRYGSDGYIPAWTAKGMTFTRNVQDAVGRLAAGPSTSGGHVLQLSSLSGEAVVQLPVDTAKVGPRAARPVRPLVALGTALFSHPDRRCVVRVLLPLARSKLGVRRRDECLGRPLRRGLDHLVLRFGRARLAGGRARLLQVVRKFAGDDARSTGAGSCLRRGLACSLGFTRLLRHSCRYAARPDWETGEKRRFARDAGEAATCAVRRPQLRARWANCRCLRRHRDMDSASLVVPTAHPDHPFPTEPRVRLRARPRQRGAGPSTRPEAFRIAHGGTEPVDRGPHPWPQARLVDVEAGDMLAVPVVLVVDHALGSGSDP